jgi:biotin-(acetyl-CoA carboxylase) ligase
MLSVGFRPVWLAPDRAWRLAATVSLAMADSAEDAAVLRVGRIRLKWPNDLVVETAVGDPGATALGAATTIRKLGGVLGESDGLGTADPRVIIGIGVNADWAARDFPPDLAATMTSLREASDGRPIDAGAVLDGFIDRLEARIEALRRGYFDIAAWVERQVTTGRMVRLEGHAGEPEEVLAVGVDGETGALQVADPGAPTGERSIHAGEITRIRLAGTNPL